MPAQRRISGDLDNRNEMTDRERRGNELRTLQTSIENALDRFRPLALELNSQRSIGLISVLQHYAL